MSRSRKKNWGCSIALSCCSKKKDKAIFHRIYRAHERDCIKLGQFDLIGGKMLKHQRRWTWQCEAMLFSTITKSMYGLRASAIIASNEPIGIHINNDNKALNHIGLT